MKTKFTVLLLCLLTNQAFGRKVITGNIVEVESKTPIELAKVELVQLPDSVVAEFTSTNSEGLYNLFKADTTKNYCLRMSKIFFKTQIIPLQLTTTGRIVNVGSRELEPSSISIKEVVVNGSKIKVSELADRTIYGISTDMKKTSTDGLDVLRKVPTVQVDYFNEDIKVEGKSNIKIEVDGISRDKNYLKKLHPSQIDKMEVITNPTGKYDADVDAVINIITIKEMGYGLKGMVNAMLLPNSLNNYMARGNTSLDYGLKKISYYLSANGGTGKFDMINSMTRNTGTNGLVRDGSSKINFGNVNVNGGFNYDPNELNNMSMNISYNANGSKSDNFQTNNLTESGTLINKNGTTNLAENQNTGINASLFYKHKFSKTKDHAYEIETSFYNSLKNNNTSNYQNIFYDLTGVELSRSTLQLEENKNRKSSASLRSSYTLPFDSVYNFNSGISANYNYSYIDNLSSRTNAPNQDYRDLKSSLYAEFSKTFKKGSAKIGSRLEISNVIINTLNKNTYVSPLPYANCQYKLNDKNSLKLNYSRRVFRPSNSQLNPFVSYSDSLTESHGNIGLKPAYRDNIQLTNSMKFGKNKFSGNISPQLFYEYRTGLIQNITTVKQGTNIFEKFPVNISNGYETGVNMAVSAQIAVVVFNSNFRYTRIHTDKYLDQIDAVNKNSWSMNMQVMCPLPKELRFFAFLSINGPTMNGQELTKSAPFNIIGISKQFKNNSSLTLMAFNPFATRNFYTSNTIDNGTLYQKSESYMNFKNAFLINYSINFKVGKDVNSQKRNQEQSQDDNMMKLPF